MKTLLDLGTFLMNDGQDLDYEPFLSYLKDRFDLVEKEEALQDFDYNIVEFLFRDDDSDPRKNQDSARKLGSKWELREMTITVLSLILENYETRDGVPSKTLFEKVHNCEVERRIWDQAVKHYRSVHKNTPFLYQVNGREQVLDTEEVLECLIDSDLVTEVPGHLNQSGDQVYELEPGKTIDEIETVVTKILRRELGSDVNKTLVHRYWPRDQVRKFKLNFHHCKYCDEREEMLRVLRKDFDIELDETHRSHSHAFPLTQIQIHRIRVNARRRLLRKREKENLDYILRCLTVVDAHFSRNLKQRSWWNQLRDNLPLTTVLFQLDFKKTLYYTTHRRQQTNSSLNGTCPFCLVVIYRDSETREVQKLTRVLIPDVKHPNAFITLECLKHILEDDSDVLLQEVLETARNIFTMSDSASYLVSKEVALFLLWEIIHLFPHLRSSSITQRECRHGIVDPDRVFGEIQRALNRALQNAPCPKGQVLKKIIYKMVRKKKYNQGKIHMTCRSMSSFVSFSS